MHQLLLVKNMVRNMKGTNHFIRTTKQKAASRWGKGWSHWHQVQPITFCFHCDSLLQLIIRPYHFYNSL